MTENTVRSPNGMALGFGPSGRLLLYRFESCSDNMGMKKIILRDPLPLEVGKTYTTKMQTKEKFTVSRIVSNTVGVQVTVYGVYEKAPHLGDCPLPAERLIPETVPGEEVEVCEHCGKR